MMSYLTYLPCVVISERKEEPGTSGGIVCRSVVTVYHRTKFGGRQSLVRILAASPMQRAWSCSILAVFFIRTTSNYYLPTS